MSANRLEVAVLGAGNGGQAMAGWLASKGCSVRVTDLFPEKLAELRRKGSVELEGQVEAKGQVRVVDDQTECVHGADLVLMATAAPGQRPVIEAAAPGLADGQVLFVTPGYWSSLTIPRHLERIGCAIDLVYVEAESLIYACRAVEPGRVHIHYEKDEMGLAVQPRSETARVLELLHPFYPQLQDRGNIWAARLNNINYTLHPSILLSNAGRAEATGGQYMFYTEGVNRGVVRLVEAVDRERMALGAEAGLRLPSTCELLRRFYTVGRSDDLLSVISTNPAYQSIRAPLSLDHRYLTEDVPYGLVPMSHLGQLLGVGTPVMDGLIEMASALLDVDFRATGLSVDALGLADLSRDGLLRSMQDESAES